MKSKKLAIIFGASLLAMTVTGCNHFGSFLPPELESLEISTSKNKSFVKGDYFLDCVDVEISAYYSNGKKRELSVSDVDLYYINEETGSRYSIGTPIPQAGNYTVQATYNKVTSPSYNFTALGERVYANSIRCDEGGEEELVITMVEGTSRTISLNVSPSNYTEKISFNNINPRNVYVEKLDLSNFEITAGEVGRTQIDFGAYKSDKLETTKFRLIIIIEPIVYVDYIIPLKLPQVMESRRGLYFGLEVHPVNANVDIEFEETNDTVHVKDEGNRRYYLFSNHVGKVVIIFAAKKNPTEYYHLYWTITVTERYIESLSVDEEIDIPINTSKQVNVYYEPFDEYVSVEPEAYLYNQNIIDVTFKDYARACFEFVVFGKKLGETDLVFRAQTSETTWTTATAHIVVKEIYAESISVIGPNTINANYEGYLDLDIQPEGYSLDTTCTSSNSSIVSVSKVDTTTYKIKGLAAGNATLTFTATGANKSNVTCTFKMRVLNKRFVKNIDQIYYDFSGEYLRPTSSVNDSVNVLVLPVLFTDTQDHIGNFKLDEVWQDVYNSWFGDVSKTKYETVNSFYKKESFGKFDLQGTVAPWQKAGCTSESIDTVGKAKNLAKTIVDNYFIDNPWDSRKNYDSDDNGYIDFVALIAGCHPNSGMSSYQTSAGNLASVNAPTLKNYFWSDIYACRKYDIDREKDDLLRVDPFLHETGHMFGVMDYYHSSLYGEFNMQGANDGGHDPWTVMAIGWANPIFVTSSTTITINEFTSSHDFIVLRPSTSWNSYNSPFDEFIIIELVGEEGLNEYFVNRDRRYLRGNAGIRVYHVDARLANKSSNPWQYTSDVGSGYGIAYGSGLVNGDPYNINNNVLLQMIRNNTAREVDYYNGGSLRESDFFYEGDTFDLYSFRDQLFGYWVEKDKYITANGEPQNAKERISMDSALSQYVTLNNGETFGWKFTISKISNNPSGHMSATITITKTA